LCDSATTEKEGFDVAVDAASFADELLSFTIAIRSINAGTFSLKITRLFRGDLTGRIALHMQLTTVHGRRV
jgi:hypothetical protein